MIEANTSGTDLLGQGEANAPVPKPVDIRSIQTQHKQAIKGSALGPVDLLEVLTHELCDGRPAFDGKDAAEMDGVSGLLARLGPQAFIGLGEAISLGSGADIVTWYRQNAAVLSEGIDFEAPPFSNLKWTDDFDQMRRQVQNKLIAAQDRKRWQATFLEAIWMLVRAEQSGEVTRERITDALLNACRRVTAAGNHDDALSDFLKTQYRMLAEDPNQRGRLSLGIVQSLSTVADTAGRGTRRGLLQLSIRLYLKTLELLATHYANQEEDFIGVWARIQAITNNVSGRLSTLGGLDSGVRQELPEGERQISQLMNRLHALNCVGEAVLRGGDPSHAELWLGFGFDLTAMRDTEVPMDDLRWLTRLEAVVRTMNNVLSSWAHLSPVTFPLLTKRMGYLGEDSRLVMAAFGAMLRAAQADRSGDDMGDPASSLFNTGLSVTRLFKRLAFPDANGEWLEIICYLLGACWSFTRAKSMAEALQVLHGGSCLVNLAGALTRAPRHQEALPHFQAVVRETTIATLNGSFVGQDANRFANSALELLGESTLRELRYRAADAEHDPAALFDNLLGLLKLAMQRVMNHFKLPDEAPAIDRNLAKPGQFAAAAMPLVVLVVQATLKAVSADNIHQGKAETSFAAVRATFADLLNEMTTLMRDPRLQIKGLTDVSSELRRMVGDTSGSWSEDEADPDISALPPSYAQWFSQAGTFTWLPSVQLRGSND